MVGAAPHYKRDGQHYGEDDTLYPFWENHAYEELLKKYGYNLSDVDHIAAEPEPTQEDLLAHQGYNYVNVNDY